jgi:hypothetical protein
MVNRIPWLRIFVALVAIIGVVTGALLWINANHREENLSIADAFKLVEQFPDNYYEIAEIMRPIAEAGDVNAQVNLAMALDWRRIGSKDKESAVQDFEEERKWWCLAAIQGDAEAQNVLAKMTYNENKSEAEYWRKLAAENGQPEALQGMAHNYHFGTEVVRDDKKALQLLHTAAEMGDDPAQLDLGDIYFDGNGNWDPPWTQVRQDYAEAAKWYLSAAQRGNSIAQRKIGLMYYGGFGVVQDFAEAYFWLNLVVASPFENAMGGEDLSSARRMRDEAASHLTTERLNRTQELLAKWRALPSTRDKWMSDWRKNPSGQSDDGRRVTDLFAGSVCSRWNVPSQKEAKVAY